MNGADSVTHRGKNNPRSFIKRYAFSNGFRDRDFLETVYIGESSEELRLLLMQTYGSVKESWCDLERGEVLLDTRGTGSVQCCVGAFQI